MSNVTMPAHLQGTPMAATWDAIVKLAADQNVDPATSAIDVSSLPADQVQALDALGAVELKTDGTKTMATLKSQPTEKPAENIGTPAASKPHQFAKKPA